MRRPHDLGSTATVRLASAADAAALSALRYEWRVTEAGSHGMEHERYEAALRSWLIEHAASHVAFLAEEESRPIGIAWLAIVDRVPAPERFVRRSAYVQSTYVEAASRGRGVGGLMLDAMIDHARTIGLDYLAVHPSERSFSFYRRHGFSEPSRVLELELGR